MIKRSVGRRTKTSRKSSFDTKIFLKTDGSGHTIVKYRTGETVFSQGGPADVAFYVLKGKVKQTVVSEQGKEAVVAIHGPDQFFGEGCLTGQPRRVASAAALSDYGWRRQLWSACFMRSQRFPGFHRSPSDPHAPVEEDLVDQLFNSSERRLARTLLLLANFDKGAMAECLSLGRSARRRSQG